MDGPANGSRSNVVLPPISFMDHQADRSLHSTKDSSPPSAVPSLHEISHPMEQRAEQRAEQVLDGETERGGDKHRSNSLVLRHPSDAGHRPSLPSISEALSLSSSESIHTSTRGSDSKSPSTIRENWPSAHDLRSASEVPKSHEMRSAMSQSSLLPAIDPPASSIDESSKASLTRINAGSAPMSPHVMHQSPHTRTYPPVHGFVTTNPRSVAMAPPQPPPLHSPAMANSHHNSHKVERTQQAYSETIKRHFQGFDLQRDLIDLLDSTRKLGGFAEHYCQKAYQSPAAGPIPPLPSIEELEVMFKQSEIAHDRLLRLQAAVMEQLAAEAEQRKKLELQMAAHEASGEAQKLGPQDTSLSFKDGLPSDPKKRRGRTAAPGRCHSCNREETPEWRRGPDGARTLCNACGLHYAKLTRKAGIVKANASMLSAQPNTSAA